MISRAAAVASFVVAAAGAWAQPVHYSVQLRIDSEKRILSGIEEVDLRRPATLSHKANLTIRQTPSGASRTESGIGLPAGKSRIEFEVKPGPGFRWLDGGGLVTMFHCGAWMLCDPDPGYRATLRLEIVVPAASGLRAVGPGRLTGRTRDGDGEHFVHEVRDPAQSFLFSFAVARLERSSAGVFEILSVRPPLHSVHAVIAEAYRFFREKAGIGWRDPHYTQAFLPLPGAGQEAAGMALMSQPYLDELGSRDSVELMAHEMAHQWWAVLVGIRSWSDFWLNEGLTEFMTAAFVEHHSGRAAYDAKMRKLRDEMEKLRAEGKDRPLHWERWKDAVDALGPVPYRKGALFLDRLRKELGDAPFWRGIALYTRRHAGKLVDSRDFQRAMEEAAGRSLAALFEEGVYR